MQEDRMDLQIGDQNIGFETGKVACQANGAVMVRCGETMVLATACRTEEPLEDCDFLPLRVDYQEKFSAVGKTVSGFIKREGKPSEREILTSRLIDRPLRPLFEEGYYHDVQILSYVLSYDAIHSPDVLAVTAASAALALSDIPLRKPIGAVRIGRVNGKVIVNPTLEQQKQSELELILAGTAEAILMIEGTANFLTEEQILEAIEIGHQAICEIATAISQWQAKIGKPKKVDRLKLIDPAVPIAIRERIESRLKATCHIKEKAKREQAVKALEIEICTALSSESANPRYSESDLKKAFKELQASLMRQMILDENVRADGRANTEIRPISIEQSFLPRTHGSSLFTRGETQSLAICVLGGDSMGQRYEDLLGEGLQRFYMQYFFPPFSVGEVGRIGPPGRREIGHGKLAEKALLAVLPSKDKFPYTIRLESNITGSNGSSSMASVCSGCLALMDAGVPIIRPVAGIAMGLILEKGRLAILSDILGIEDALGDMDFKIAGDDKGITAFQMDIKIEGITIAIMRSALAQAKAGLIHILNTMLAVCPKSREQMSPWAPRIQKLQVKPSKIGTIIGPGGKQIRAIIEETGVDIDINNDGTVIISSTSLEGIEKAKAIVAGLTAEIEIAKVYDGKVSSIVNFGVFVELLPGKEGLCHISELEHYRIEDIFQYTQEKNLKVGDPIAVIVLEINDRGQVKLSQKAVPGRPKEFRDSRRTPSSEMRSDKVRSGNVAGG
jgi:polyribonucleotide nucleotidyltransferase